MCIVYHHYTHVLLDDPDGLGHSAGQNVSVCPGLGAQLGLLLPPERVKGGHLDFVIVIIIVIVVVIITLVLKAVTGPRIP